MTGLDRLRKEKEKDEGEAHLDASQAVTHWQVDSVDIKTDPVLDMQVDGDVVGKTPQSIRILAKGLRVVVGDPAHSEKKDWI